MFRPFYGKCLGSRNHQGCGREKQPIKTKRGLCPYCEQDRKQEKRGDKQVYQIRKRSEKKTKEIKESQQYYKLAIAMNILKNNGVLRCDECGHSIPIPKPGKGSNVCHIVSQGANPRVYLDIKNHVILGEGLPGQCNCKWVFDESGKRHTMKIYARTEEIRDKLIGR